MPYLNIEAQTRLIELRQNELLAEAALSRRLKEGRGQAPKVSLLARLGLRKPAPPAEPVRA